MEYLFENHSVRNEESIKAIYGRMMWRPVCICIYLLYLTVFLWGVYYVYIGERLGFLYLILAIGVYFFAWRKYRGSVTIALKRDLELYGAPPEISVLVSNDEILHKASNGAEYRLQFNSIRRVYQTGRFIYLCSESKLIYQIQRDGFTVGNAEDFLSFLRSKGVKV